MAVDTSFGDAEGGLSYSVDEPLFARLRPGQLVWVPLRKQRVLGVVLDLDRGGSDFELRPLISTVEPSFCLSAEQLEIARWLARETASSLFAAASPFFPPGVSHRAVEYLRLADPDSPFPDDVTPAQRRLLDLLAAGEETTLDAARKKLGTSLVSVAAKLEARGLLERVVRVVDQSPSPRLRRFVRLLPGAEIEVGKAPRQRAVLEYLRQRARLAPDGWDGDVPVSEVLAGAGVDRTTIVALSRKGFVEERALPERQVRDRPQGSALMLTGEQAAVWSRVERALVNRETTPFLLHGVTGSGKTEIYLRAAAWCLRHGRSVIILVPEIALASQVVRRFEARFPEQVAVLHSALRDGERHQTWKAVAAGAFPVVVGPRSALFAPLSNLGLIVLDEEHEGSYKQEADPRYHARTLAERIGGQTGATLLLGSATPAVESFWRSESGSMERLELLRRVGGPSADGGGHAVSIDLPDVHVVDMRHELHRGSATILSEQLQELMSRTLAAGEQGMLLLNRRGTATIVLCRSCGASITCPHCDIPLVYHQDRGRLLCHRCNYREMPSRQCARCAGPLNYFGMGTQRVEDEVRRLFPAARVMRWDQDAVAREGGHERLLRRVERREVDIVVGTQMIAKGLDLPMVTAVGVVQADTLLHLPDFRSTERTFQLLTQVAGRAGRRAEGGRVVVQTYSPDHYAIRSASRHDYRAFYDEEIAFRKTHRYPPFSRLSRHLFRHQDEEVCRQASDDMARLLARHARQTGVAIDLLGPTPAFASRVRGKYQWQIVLRAMPADFDALLDGMPTHPAWVVDIDPQSML
ncbi:MAG: replication restart helicase PriA [Thermomicrobiales bacterium]